MAEYYFSVILDSERTLCLAPLTDRRLAMSGQDIDDASGYFLYEKRGTGELAEIEILARALSEEAAERLRAMFSMA
jgi:hypothetical protein